MKAILLELFKLTDLGLKVEITLQSDRSFMAKIWNPNEYGNDGRKYIVGFGVHNYTNLKDVLPEMAKIKEYFY